MTRYSYNKDLVFFSKSNRKNQTESEKLLWRHLRNRIHGFKFRRQFPIDKYILDFYCIQKKLAVELDGGQHLQNRDYDIFRSNILAQRGIKILRFWDSEVFKNLNGVLEKIISELERE